jgi:hypothetical protein
MLSILSFAFGVIGVALSVASYYKMKSAQLAEREIERKFMHYMAAQEFESLAVQAIDIMGKVARREWSACGEPARKISLAFGNARGARTRLLESLERDKLNGAGLELGRFLTSLSIIDENAVVSVEQIQEMISQCQVLVNIASELTGRLGVESILQAEEKK